MEEKKYLCFGDFEFTCGGHINRNTCELLSVGIVICDEKFKIVKTFYCTCRPVSHPKMTKQCIELTHLSQQEIYNSPDSNEVLKIVSDLLYEFDIYDLCVWGNFDIRGIENDLRIHKKHSMEYEYIDDVADAIFDIQSEIVRQLGLPEAVNIEELSGVFGFTPTEGTYHNALNDAMGLYAIYRGAYTTDFINNKRFLDLKQRRIERIEAQRQRAAQKRRDIALTISLCEEEISYIDSFPETERDEARIRLLDNRYYIVKGFINHPEDEDFVFVAFEEPKKPKLVLASLYASEKNPGMVFAKPVSKDNFAPVLVEYLRLGSDETVTL